MGGLRFWLIAVFGVLCLITWLWFVTLTPHPSSVVNAIKSVPTPAVNVPAKEPDRILFVNSYHAGYPWSDGIFSSFVKTLGLSQLADDLWGNAALLLKNFYMDSKRHPDEKSKLAATAAAKHLIESWQPDIIVTSDDNAVKYLVAPLTNKSSLPFVFTGVNWDASEYHLPFNQVTGMLEVQPVDQIIAALQPYADGNKVCFLKGKDFSTIKEADAFEKFLHISLQRHFVSTFSDWARTYREAQQECSILLVGNPVSIPDWNEAQAHDIIRSETRIPTGAWSDWMRHYALLTFSTVASEQGSWAATATLDILNGQSPANITITRNRKAKIYRNMAIAKQLKIVFPMEFIRRSLAVEQDLPQ